MNMNAQVIFALSALAAFTLHAGSELSVVRADLPIKVDGRLSEHAYVGYDWSAPFVVFDRENAVTNGLFEPVGKPFSNLRTQCGVFTDGTNLYAVVLAPCAAQQPPCEGDGIGVAVSPDGKTLLVAECDLAGKCSAWRIGLDGAKTPIAASGVRAGINSHKGGFEVELAVPYAAIGRTPGRVGSVWRCNVYRKGPSCGGTSSWSPVQGDMFNLDRFGRIMFGTVKSRGASALQENKGKTVFLWSGERWGGNPSEPPPLDETELGKVTLFGPRGGRAVAHFRVSNLTDRPALYSLKPHDFKNNKFARRVRFREVGNLELKGGPTVPDPIFDLPNGSVLRIPPKSTAMVWVDVATEGMKPGVHKATLKLIPGYSRFRGKELSLELTVGKANAWELDMPTWTYSTRYPDNIRGLKDYRFNVINLLEPHFGPTPDSNGKRDWSMFDAAVEAILENGIPTNEVRFLFYHLFPRWSNPRKYKKVEDRIIDAVRAGINHARERFGIGVDRIWFSTVDEPHGDPDDLKSLASHAFYGARLAKRIDPGLKSWTNPYKSGEMQYLPRYLEEFDALTPFLPVINNDDPTASKCYANSGKDIWSYTIYLKQNRPVQYRSISWKHLIYGFEGPAGFYTLFQSSGDMFNSYDADGAADYGAVYKDERTRQLFPSLRLEAWYQGHIEQRLTKWCRNRISKMTDRQKAESFGRRLNGLVSRAAAPRPNFDAISRELLDFSDELAEAK